MLRYQCFLLLPPLLLLLPCQPSLIFGLPAIAVKIISDNVIIRSIAGEVQQLQELSMSGLLLT